MNSQHDIDARIEQSRQFVQNFADGGREFLRTHLPEHFIVATPTESQLMAREQFIEAARRRAALVVGDGFPAPTLVAAEPRMLGDGYCLVTATWVMPLEQLNGLRLVEDLLIDQTGENWLCLAYLLRQDLPNLLRSMGTSMTPR